VLEVSLDLGGYPVQLFDTAGLREAESEAETEGVRRARDAAEAADLVLWLDDATRRDEPVEIPAGPAIWRIGTKIDLLPESRRPKDGISAVTGEGIGALIERIGVAAASSLGTGDALVTRQRQKEAIQYAVAALAASGGASDEVLADLLRSASDAIGRLSGRIDVEDVLDRLFAEFCIGK